MSKILKEHLLDWVWDFCINHKIVSKSSKVIIGLSGGKDSMLLGSVFYDLYKRGRFSQIKFVHINHGLRKNSHLQAQSLEKWCNEHNWPLTIESYSGKKPKSNIELWGRELRKSIFTKHRQSFGKEGVVLLGHHIDDSFEWYLRQLLNSSSGKQAFGIPVINGFYRRPFHCLTRQQINMWVNKLGLFYLHDESNDDHKFERNFIRHKIKNELLIKFPKGLAHFCARGNDWAKKEKLHTQVVSSCKTFCPQAGVIYLYQLDGHGFFEGQTQVISEVIKKLSSQKRGELRQNINKLIEAQKNGKRGPMNFSGGVYAYSYPGMIIFCNKLGLKYFNSLDANISNQIQLTSQIPDVVSPFNINKKKMHGLKSIKSDPLFPLTSHAVALKGWWMRPHSHILLKIS